MTVPVSRVSRHAASTAASEMRALTGAQGRKQFIV